MKKVLEFIYNAWLLLSFLWVFGVLISGCNSLYPDNDAVHLLTSIRTIIVAIGYLFFVVAAHFVIKSMPPTDNTTVNTPV
jgi:hypothetical protein